MVTARDPQATRRRILEITADEMAKKGFKATSLSEILSKTDVSKGALYHHFPTKLELGYAVMDEIYIAQMLENWNIPMSAAQPLDALAEWFNGVSKKVTPESLEHGCPVNKLASEMSGTDSGFRQRIQHMYHIIENRLAEMLKTAQLNRQIKEDVVPEAVAKFIMAAFQGIASQGCYTQDIDIFRSTIACMSSYILSLKN